MPNTIVNARTNLRADVFNVLHQIQRGNKDAARERASLRALQALSPTPIIRPDEFPFPIALDVTEYAFKKHAPPQLVTSGNKRYEVIEAYKLAQNVLSSFENESLKIWAQFVGPCQIMAWSGHSPSQILGAATLSSPNPFVKATGHLLAEITKIQPVTDAQLTQGYNPFLDDEINLIRHTRNVDETFEMAMIHCMEADSHLPFLRVANNQNEGLLKGHISGWCAHALQSAAKAYMGARDFGVPPHQAARLEFQMVKKQDGWRALLQVSQYIMELARKGTEAKTLSNLAAWCNNQPEFRFMVNSLAMTISDPTYSAKMKVAVEMPSVTPLAAATQMKSVSRPAAFTPAPAHMPSLGLGGGGGLNLDDAKKILLED